MEQTAWYVSNPPFRNLNKVEPGIMWHALTLMYQPQSHQKILQSIVMFPSPNLKLFVNFKDVAAVSGLV